MVGHKKWSEIKHKSTPEQRDAARKNLEKNLEYTFKKRKRKDLINAMQITVYSMTDAELDKKLRKEVEEAIEAVIKAHKDSQALAYSIVKE